MDDEESSLPSTTNTTTTSERVTALSITVYLLFALIFLISLVGNLLVCLVIGKTRTMRTTRNYLIVNLALADLTVAVVCIPFDIVIKVYNPQWPLGPAMCKAVWPLMTLVTTCSAATLLAISYDRYRAVIRLRKPFPAQQTAAVIIAAWSFSFLLVIPYIVFLRVKDGKCTEEWPSDLIRRLYTVGLFLFQYVFPLLFIAVAYVAVVVKLRQQSKYFTSNGHNLTDDSTTSNHSAEKAGVGDGFELGKCSTLSGAIEKAPQAQARDRLYSTGSYIFPALNAKSEARRIERNKKIVKMLITVVLVYAICLLPNQVVWLGIEFESIALNDKLLVETLLNFSSLLVYINSAVNPILYAGMNTDFRKGFAKALGCHEPSRKTIRTSNQFMNPTA